MQQLINALKAPFVDPKTFPEADRPSDRQIAAMWLMIGVVATRVL